MDIIKRFYDNLASQYEKLFSDWEAATFEQAMILNQLFENYGFDHTAQILDCACGIGTQAIGLARMGYHVIASDISEGALVEAKRKAAGTKVEIHFEHADFRDLAKTFQKPFDIVIAMDNALPHMLSKEDLECAIKSIANQMKKNGIFVGSIRDYDALIEAKPLYSPPYIHKTDKGQRVSFQTWDWDGDHYKLKQYIIEDGECLQVSKFECEYRATRREELTNLFLANGCSNVVWLLPERTGFYQPIVIAQK